MSGSRIGVSALCLWQQSFVGGENREEEILGIVLADRRNHDEAPDQSLAREIGYC